MTPRFLMGGANLMKNFMGPKTMQATFYSGVEMGIKGLPLLMFFVGMGKLIVNFDIDKTLINIY